MADLTLTEAIAKVRRRPHRTELEYGFAAEVILNAVASGDLIPKSDAELAAAEAIRRAAEAAYEADSLELSIHGANGIAARILALTPADALAEVQRLREELDHLSDKLGLERALTDGAHKRARIAEAERGMVLARVEKLHHLITEASDPNFIWGAMDNVHDAEATLDDYAEAVSRAIRGAMQITGEAE